MDTVSCRQQISFATVTVQVERASDRRVVYSTTKPYRDASFWCEGDRPPDSVDVKFQAIIEQVAREIIGDISPTLASYKVRLLESTSGLSKPGAAMFKAAVKTSTRDLLTSCERWKTLLAQGEKSDPLFFAVGICAEQSGDLATASQQFAQASNLMPGDKTIAEASARIRTLTASRAQATAQASQRAGSEEGERQRILAEQESARRGAAAAQRAARSADAAARRKDQQREAAAVAARQRQRQDVAQRYGAGAVDAILSGTVTKGDDTGAGAGGRGRRLPYRDPVAR